MNGESLQKMQQATRITTTAKNSVCTCMCIFKCRADWTGKGAKLYSVDMNGTWVDKRNEQCVKKRKKEEAKLFYCKITHNLITVELNPLNQFKKISHTTVNFSMLVVDLIVDCVLCTCVERRVHDLFNHIWKM